MNEAGVTEAAPGWGWLNSPVAIVGQSLCEQCMEPQEPFYQGSGDMLEASFAVAGCDKADMFITNVVHCHPPGNRQSHPHEILNCSAYLFRELEIVRPRLVVGLGGDAKRLLSFFYPTARQVVLPFSPAREVQIQNRAVSVFHRPPVLGETKARRCVRSRMGEQSRRSAEVGHFQKVGAEPAHP